MNKSRISFFLIAGIFLLILFGRYWYFRPKLSLGEVAPDFVTVDYRGDSISLEEFRGGYLLLDFWGSWCGPCRKDNPNIVKIHEEFKDQRFKDGQGLKVLSVAVETNEASWRAAVKKDNLSWENHIVSTEKFDHPVLRLYQIREIPTKYLINPKGIIVGVNPNYDEMRKILTKRQ